MAGLRDGSWSIGLGMCVDGWFLEGPWKAFADVFTLGVEAQVARRPQGHSGREVVAALWLIGPSFTSRRELAQRAGVCWSDL
jgi:hypothetical protein